jgi:predicted nucleic acid-binding protein
MFVFLDSSVVVPLLIDKHESHGMCQSYFESKSNEDCYVTARTLREISGLYHKRINDVLVRIWRNVRNREFDLSDADSRDDFEVVFGQLREDSGRASAFVDVVKDSCERILIEHGRPMRLDFLPEWGMEYASGIKDDVLELIGNKSLSDLPAITSESQVEMRNRLRGLTSEINLPEGRDENILWELVVNAGRFLPAEFCSRDGSFIKRANSVIDLLVEKQEVQQDALTLVLIEG